MVIYVPSLFSSWKNSSWYQSSWLLLLRQKLNPNSFQKQLRFWDIYFNLYILFLCVNKMFCLSLTHLQQFVKSKIWTVVMSYDICNVWNSVYPAYVGYVSICSFNIFQYFQSTWCFFFFNIASVVLLCQCVLLCTVWMLLVVFFLFFYVR